MNFPALFPILLALALTLGCGDDGSAPRHGNAQDDRATRAAGAPESSPETPGGLGVEGAVTVIRDYYDAINRREYGRAYRLWGNNGSASGQTLAGFQRGFAETASVEVDIGDPSRIEGAAGSRYIEIPVTITAIASDQKVQRFSGKYVLRRTVVDGASAEQRKWHINSADISRIRE